MGGGILSRNSHHLFGLPTQRLVFGIDGFECRASMVVLSLLEPAGNRLLQAVDNGSQSVVPGDLPLPPSRVSGLPHPKCEPVS